MKKVFLHDKFTLGDKSRLDNFGFLHVDNVIIARTGIQHYLESEIFEDGDQTKRIGVARLKKDILDSESIETFKNIPLTDNHPSEFVTSKNFSKYQKGSISNVEPKDGKYLSTDITINDEELIEKVQNGKVELSVGYSTVLVAEDGELNGEKYSFRQTDIVANHVAVVQFGRCGSECSLIGDDGSLIKITDKRKNMKTIKIDDSNIEVDDKVASHIKMLDTKIEVLKNENKLSEQKLATAKTDAMKDMKAMLDEKSTLDKIAKENNIKLADGLNIKETKEALVIGFGYKVEGRDESEIKAIIEVMNDRGQAISDEKKTIDSKKLPTKDAEDAELWNALNNTKIGG